MESINFYDAEFELFEINGIKTLFSYSRIKRQSLPDGCYMYQLRANDSNTAFATIEKYVRVNYEGTIITQEEIPMKEGDYTLTEDYTFEQEINPDDWRKEYIKNGEA